MQDQELVEMCKDLDERSLSAAETDFLLALLQAMEAAGGPIDLTETQRECVLCLLEDHGF